MKTLFLADKTARDPRSKEVSHPGGAELTDAAAVEACPWPIVLAPLREVGPDDISRADLIVLGNASEVTEDQLRALVEHPRLVLFEHDVRICAKRGNFPACKGWVHRYAQRCTCRLSGVESLFGNARGVVYLTERQRRVYEENPFFGGGGRATVLGSSLFDRAFFSTLASLRDGATTRRGVLVNRSTNVIKGYEEARAWATQRGWNPEELSNLAPDEVLRRLASAETFVYLPRGLEPAGRMPVEARLLGCSVVVNEHVGVAGEPFWRGGTEEAWRFLTDGPRRFWRQVEHLVRLPRLPPVTRQWRGLAAVPRVLGRATEGRWLPRPIRRRLSEEARRRASAVTVVPRW